MTRLLRTTLITLYATLLMATILSTPSLAQDPPDQNKKEEQHTCIVTEMPWEASPTRVEAVFNLDGELLRGYFVSLAYMYLLRDSLIADGSTVEIRQVKMLDYSTYGTDNEQLITVDKLGSNIHLILIDESLEGTKSPYILAYSSKSAAMDAIARDGGKFTGEYLPWDKAVTRILEALEMEPEEMEPSDAMGD